jgi:hypothetical protein
VTIAHRTNTHKELNLHLRYSCEGNWFEKSDDDSHSIEPVIHFFFKTIINPTLLKKKKL